MSMVERRLGGSGSACSALGYGGLPLSRRADRPSEDESIRLIRRAIDLGITLLDTADCYCIDGSEVGHNERLFGRALAECGSSVRERLVVASKGGLIHVPGRLDRDGSPEHLRRACEQSLRNLGVEAIDLYQYHRVDPKVALEESLGALAGLQEAGKIRHIGVSNFSVEQLSRARRVVDIVSVQNEFSPSMRVAEDSADRSDGHCDPDIAGTLEASGEMGLAFLCWSPLGGARLAGLLAGRSAAAGGLAGRLGVSVYRLALAWLLAKGSHVIPVFGARRMDHLEDSALAAGMVLDAEMVGLLDEAWAATDR